MKRILIGDGREDLLSTLEVILKNWGYRALATSNADEFRAILSELSPQLIIAGPAFLSTEKTASVVRKQASPVLLIEDAKGRTVDNIAGEELDYPVDVFRLFEFVQKTLEKIPRRNIRLNVQLPGMYYHGESPCIAEVVSLSSEGLFIRTGTRLEGLDEVRVILPLFGMQTEIELSGRIVYRVEPTPDNNYIQGMGIEFKDVEPENARKLQQFVENLLFNELSDRKHSSGALNLDMIQKRASEMLLKIQPVRK